MDKIIKEVKYAIVHNRGQVKDSRNTYYGFSKDGKIEIHYYYNENTKEIFSYFPKIK